MAEMKNPLEPLGRLFSRRRILDIGKTLDAAGLSVPAEVFAGGAIVAFLVGGLLSTLIAIQFVQARLAFISIAKVLGESIANNQFAMLFLVLIVMFIISTVLLALLVYVFLSMRIESRKRQVESVLPDFLTLAAANVRAGMNVDQAMWYAAKPEFGQFSGEVELVAKRTFGGEPFNTAIDRLNLRYNSKILRRTVSLIKQGLASGGQMADIFDQIATDTRNIQLIQKEIAASLLMYVIFVVFAASVGAPFLFAVSNNLIGILENVFANLPDVSQLPAIGFVRPQPPLIGSADFFMFTIVTTVITAIFSSLIIGVIQKGSKTEGLKYLPLFLALSLIIYIAVNSLLSQFLSSLV
ncbi:MAG: type II secretion system F family protein [Candidatus Micrarchaeia archaeon]